MEETLKQITWHLNVLATEVKRYNDAQGYPPSKLTENMERKKQKMEGDPSDEVVSNELREFINRLKNPNSRKT